MGSGVAGMHYMGMAAMRMMPGIVYDPWLFALSVVIAIAASGTALWMAFKLRHSVRHVGAMRAAAACVMGVAIVGMHYTGMAAADFPLGSICSAAGPGNGTDANWLALTIIVSTLAVLAIALITSVLDLRLESRTSMLARSLADANQELTYLALHDNLTKLPNRVLLEDRLGQAIETARRERTRFALMFMDLDGFKAVNDAYGHPVGDELVQVAARISANVRANDTVARVGGDEFVLVATVDDPADAATLADKLMAVIRQPYAVSGHAFNVSTSIGIAVYPGNGDTLHELLTNADAAMYHAKGQGRNAYCYFEASMNANVQDQVLLLQDLRMAIDRGQLELHYQPKFVSPDGPITGVEALLRWSHPVRGMVAPDQFIALAEKTGFIVAIGDWVLDEACRQIAEWRSQGLSLIHI